MLIYVVKEILNLECLRIDSSVDGLSMLTWIIPVPFDTHAEVLGSSS